MGDLAATSGAYWGKGRPSLRCDKAAAAQGPRLCMPAVMLDSHRKRFSDGQLEET